MKNTKVNVRFALREQNRILSKNNSKKGTVQIQAYITWFAAIPFKDQITIPEGTFPFTKGVLPYSINLTLGWAATALPPEQKNKLSQPIIKSIGSYKIGKDGSVQKYDRIKLQTGLYIIPECWNQKEQTATLPYLTVNTELHKIKHIIEVTYSLLSKQKDFSKELLQSTIKDRLKNGMPQTIEISAIQSKTAIGTIHAISNHLAKVDGVDIDRLSNPNGIPDNLSEFIFKYSQIRRKTKKQEKETISAEHQLGNKLKRWFDQTGKTLSITKSGINEVHDFLIWRMYDNEENVVRNSEKIKTKLQVNPIKNEAISMSTYNKTKDLLITFFNRAVAEFECKLSLSTKNIIFEQVNEEYDNRKDVYLTVEEMEQLVNLKLEKGTRLYMSRHLFVLGCLSGGYRMSDLVKLQKPEKSIFENGEEYYLFDVTSQKTNVNSLTPVPPELNWIVEEYEFGRVVTPSHFSKDIQKLGELLGWKDKVKYKILLADSTYKEFTNAKKFERLQAKTCRKTYCSLLVNFWGFTISEAGKFSGHTSDEFLKYLNLDKKAAAQQFVNKMKVKPIFKFK
jgi:hypothetical protein